MKTPKVSIYIRIRRAIGPDAFVKPAWNKNRTLRGGYAIVRGTAEYHPEGIYYLRYKRDGKRRQWTAVGSDPERAIVALRNTEHDLQAIGLGRLAGGLPDAPNDTPAAVEVTLEGAITAYVNELRRFRSAKTIAAAENMLSKLNSRLPGKLLKEVRREDLLDHMFALKLSGLGDRTIHNHMSRIGSFLRSHNIVGILKQKDLPKYDEKGVTAYNSEELSRLFAVCSPAERLLYEFFLSTGLREQEVMSCTWANIDFKSKVVSIWSKPEMGFRVKDKEERSVPVPDSLIAALLERKRTSTAMLLFPGAGGKQDGHMLRRLQVIAHRAGLNCGECVTKGGIRCSERPVCGEWGLHKFRKTFATMHSEAGVSPRTIQSWLGHADLATTLRYLAVADLRSERTRSQVNASFAQLAKGVSA